MVVAITIRSDIHLGTLTRENARYLRETAQRRVRQIAQQELNQQIRIRGGKPRYFVTVDRRPRRPINLARELVVIDFPQPRLLDAAAVVRAIQDLVYKVANIVTQPRLPGKIGDAWTYTWRRFGKRTNERTTPALIPMEGGDTVRFVPPVGYSAPLSANIAKGLLKLSVQKRLAKGTVKAKGGIVRVKRRALSSRGLAARLATRLRRLPQAAGFQATGRFFRAKGGLLAAMGLAKKLSASIGIDVTIKREKYKIRRTPKV